MRLTPLDIQQKQFARQFRGVDAHEVKQFLELCADEFEELVRENIELKEELRARDALLAETRDRERSLQEALVSAQRLATEMKDQARKEADIIVAEAELEGEKIVQDAHGRRSTLISELGELRSLKTSFESELKAIVGSHLKLMETFAESDRIRAQDDRVALFQKKEPA
jgi:cell division initiation protein